MLAPQGSKILFNNGGADMELFVDEVSYEFIIEPFERLEFSNQKLREAPTVQGAKPLIVTSFGGLPIQLASTCTGDVPRPLVPDDLNINNIKKQFEINRYTLVGAATKASYVDSMYAISKTHARFLSKFQLHLEKVSMDLSYNVIEPLQDETFAYLTSTTLTASGTSLGGSLSNLLITSFSPGVLYLKSSTGDLIKDWRMTVENREIKNRLGA